MNKGIPAHPLPTPKLFYFAYDWQQVKKAKVWGRECCWTPSQKIDPPGLAHALNVSWTWKSIQTYWKSWLVSQGPRPCLASKSSISPDTNDDRSRKVKNNLYNILTVPFFCCQFTEICFFFSLMDLYPAKVFTIELNYTTFRTLENAK